MSQALVAELVDAPDLKSGEAQNLVPVRFWPKAHSKRASALLAFLFGESVNLLLKHFFICFKNVLSHNFPGKFVKYTFYPGFSAVIPEVSVSDKL